MNRLRQRIDRQRMNIDRQRVARPDRVDQILIDPQHWEASHAVAPLVETGQQIALAEGNPSPFGFQCIHGTLGQNLDVGRVAQKAVEHGKVDDLHHVLVHPYVQAELVADHHRVGREAGRDDRIGRPDGGNAERQRGENPYFKNMLHKLA